MKTPTVVFLTLLAMVGGALALMNNTCKTERHSWCAPERNVGVIPIVTAMRFVR